MILGARELNQALSKLETGRAMLKVIDVGTIRVVGRKWAFAGPRAGDQEWEDGACGRRRSTVNGV